MGKKITQLTAVTTPVDADLLLTTTNVSTTPVSKKITWTVVKSFLKTYFDSLYTPLNSAVPNNGWISPSETWTRTGNQTFTVSGDKTSVYTLGVKIKWTQTTVKYGTVVSSSYSSPNTTVTIATNTDYVLTVASITNNYYSRENAPEGFPKNFAFSPTWTNLTVGNGTQTAYYYISETGVVDFFIHLVWGSTTSSAGGTVSFATPLNAKNTGNYVPVGPCGLVDWGASLYMGEAVMGSGTSVELRVINASGTYAVWSAVTSTVPYTWGVSDIMSINGTYLAS